MENSIAEKYLNDAIASYERIADDYPAEKDRDVSTVEPYGKKALEAAIQLLHDSGAYKPETEIRLINKYLDNYGNIDTSQSEYYRNRLRSLYSSDYRLGGDIVFINNKYWTIRLVSLDKPSISASVELNVDGKDFIISEGKEETLPSGNKIIVNRIDVGSARVTATCTSEKDKTQSATLKLNDAGQQL